MHPPQKGVYRVPLTTLLFEIFVKFVDDTKQLLTTKYRHLELKNIVIHPGK